MVELHIRAWQWAYKGLLPDDYLDRLPLTLDVRIERRRLELAHLPPDNRWWVVEQTGRIVGFALTGTSNDPDATPQTALVFALYLDRQVVGTGIGHALFTHVVNDFRQRRYTQATLWVLENNLRARRFYEAAGWTPDGTRKSEELSGVLLHEVRYHIVL